MLSDATSKELHCSKCGNTIYFRRLIYALEPMKQVGPGLFQVKNINFKTAEKHYGSIICVIRNNVVWKKIPNTTHKNNLLNCIVSIA